MYQYYECFFRKQATLVDLKFILEDEPICAFFLPWPNIVFYLYPGADICEEEHCSYRRVCWWVPAGPGLLGAFFCFTSYLHANVLAKS